MKQKIKKLIKSNDIKIIIKTYLIIIIPTIFVFILFYSFISKTEIEKTKEIIMEEQKQRANTINYIVDDVFKEIEEDILLVENSNEVYDYINNPEEDNLYSAEQLFLRFTNSKKSFDQIRFIDSSGNEVIRVNNDKEQSYLTPINELQNKKDRYYYEEASKLKAGEFFVSDMDLNVENGQIEVPHKPMIRIATPLYSDDNKYQGILIVNYLGDNALSVFNKQFNESEYSFIEPYIVNKDGYYIYNRDNEKTFGFMFKDKENNNICREKPELWDKISINHSGYFESDGEVDFFMKLNPLEKIVQGDPDDYYWVIVSKFKLEDLPIVNQSIIFGMKSLDIIILISISLLILIALIINYYSKKDKEELDITSRIAEDANDAIIITDKNTNITYVNKSFERVTGYKKTEILGLKTNYFKSGKQSKEFYGKMWKDINDKGHWEGELWDKKKDGVLYPKKLHIIAIQKKYGGGIDKYIGIFTDLTKIREEQRNVSKLKNYNIETDLPNERLLKKLIEKSIKNNENRFGIVSFSVVNYNNLRLNNNDQNKYYINSLISDIEKIIKKEDFIAQIGKNIFIIGLYSYNNKEHMDAFMEKLFMKNDKITDSNNDKVFFNIKAGISVYPYDGSTPNELINNSNIALETAIKKNDKKYVYYNPSLKESIEKEMQMNALLRNAISNNELEVYYQPQVQIDTGIMTGAEALLRWKNSELGNVSPVQFVALAEKTGQIIEIGYWLIERIFKDYVDMKDDIDHNFRISINVSPVQFEDKDLLFKFKELANKYDVNLKNFEIEITESVFINDIDDVNEELKKFKELGMTIAIDDFGTGFSSLSYLKNLSVDKLKIDRIFIKDYPDKDDARIAKVVVNMANELKLKVITEGAETREQIEYLKSIGCNLIQGYYYSKPLTKKDFYVYLLNNYKNK